MVVAADVCDDHDRHRTDCVDVQRRRASSECPANARGIRDKVPICLARRRRDRFDSGPARVFRDAVARLRYSMLPNLKLLVVSAFVVAVACGGGNTAPKDAAPAPAAAAPATAPPTTVATTPPSAPAETRNPFPIRGRPTMRCHLTCVR